MVMKLSAPNTGFHWMTYISQSKDIFITWPVIQWKSQSFYQAGADAQKGLSGGADGFIKLQLHQCQPVKYYFLVLLMALQPNIKFSPWILDWFLFVAEDNMAPKFQKIGSCPADCTGFEAAGIFLFLCCLVTFIVGCYHCFCSPDDKKRKSAPWYFLGAFILLCLGIVAFLIGGYAFSEENEWPAGELPQLHCWLSPVQQLRRGIQNGYGGQINAWYCLFACLFVQG